MIPFSFCLNHDSRNDLSPIKKKDVFGNPPRWFSNEKSYNTFQNYREMHGRLSPFFFHHAILSMQPLLITQLKVNINTHWLTTCVIFLPFPFLLRIVSIKKRHLLLNEEKVSEAWYNSIATRETRASLDPFFFFLPPSYLHIRADTRLSVRIRNRGEHKAN